MSQDISGRFQGLCWILLGWQVFKSVDLIRDFCARLFEVFYDLHHFIIRVLIVGFRILLVDFNFGLHDDELFIRLVIYLVACFWHLEA